MKTWTLVLLTFGSCTFGAVPASPSSPSQFTVVSWNVDSIQPDPHMAALRIAQMHGADLWGFAGVRDPQSAELFRQAAGENERRTMASLLSPTRGSDRLLILYDLARFERIRSYEIGWEDEPWYRSDVALRPALVAQFRHNATGQEFLFMVNSLHPKWTARQAGKIHEWARRQILPVVAVGTYYFQHNLGSEPLRCDGQAGLTTMVADGVFQWVRPMDLVKTYDSPYNTVEDFVFLANAAGKLYGRTQVVVTPNDFAGPEPTGAHRPIRATFTVLTAANETLLRRQIMEQALKVKAELDRLEALVRQLPE